MVFWSFSSVNTVLPRCPGPRYAGSSIIQTNFDRPKIKLKSVLLQPEPLEAGQKMTARGVRLNEGVL